METTRTEAIVVSDLRKNFGRLEVLCGINFDVKQGELICILGPSGCGKTTILRIIAGLLPYDSGLVLLNGEDIQNSRDYRRHTAVVFQEPRLLPWRTVWHNVRLPLELRQNKVDVTDEQLVGQALELVGLSEFTDAYPHQLSGGMRQRVALARALVTQPQVLFMDEPLTGLDLRNREELQDEIVRIWDEKKISLLLVTHDPTEALHMADRIIVLSGRPSRIRDIVTVSIPRPRSRDTAEIRALEQTIRGLFSDE
ncbi:MAG: ABC transporter ATP-binding protein [Dehalococcoidia bacterium]|nr:ABC transporter ATP-binding protein [Dehalococcoidia bacterium]